MTLIERLNAVEPFDTWPGMEMAATERFWDGLALAVSDAERYMGAIYCFGYVVEMLLKVAYFRAIGLPITQNLSVGSLNAMLKEAFKGSYWSGKQNLHNLQALVSLLIETRKRKGRPLDSAISGQILWNALIVDSHWNETLRHKYTIANEDEMHEVYVSVEWLFANKELLWS